MAMIVYMVIFYLYNTDRQFFAVLRFFVNIH